MRWIVLVLLCGCALGPPPDGCKKACAALPKDCFDTPAKCEDECLAGQPEDAISCTVTADKHVCAVYWNCARLF
jgi:hypothetical protein